MRRGSHERCGVFFREWAWSTAIEGPSLRSRLLAKREALFDEIDFEVWDPEQSKRLALLDYLLEV